MKKYIAFLLFFFVKVYFVQAQNLEESFDKLKLTSSPAYVILGIEPENIQRPSSPTEFVSGVQSAIVNGKLQPNFAMELTPYLWVRPNSDAGKKRIDVHDYLSGGNWGRNFMRNLTFSFATSESDTFTMGNLQRGIGTSFGVKFLICQGKIGKATRMDVASLYSEGIISAFYDDVKGTLVTSDNYKDVAELVDKVYENWKSTKIIRDESDKYKRAGLLGDIENEKDLIIAFIKKEKSTEALNTFLDQRIAKIRDISAVRLSKLNENKIALTREGFMLEAAAAGAGIFQENRWDNFSGAKAAVWITPSYRFNISPNPNILENKSERIDLLDLMAVFRYTANNKRVDSSNYADVGMRLQYTYNRFSISGEGIYRYLTRIPSGVNKAYTWKADVSADYKINDFLTAKLTFGANFNGNSTRYTDPKEIFAIGGLNVGFSNFLRKK